MIFLPVVELITPYFHFTDIKNVVVVFSANATYIRRRIAFIQVDVQLLPLDTVRKLDDTLLRGVGVFLVVHWGQGR